MKTKLLIILIALTSAIKILNVLGENVTPLIFRNEVIKTNDISLERGALKEGVYLIQISSENHTTTKKIIIQD